MPPKPRAPSSNRVRTRSVARSEAKFTAKIAAELVDKPEVKANTRVRTRSGTDIRAPVFEEPDPTPRGRTTSAPTAIDTSLQRVTRSSAAAQKLAAAAEVGPKQEATAAKYPTLANDHRQTGQHRAPTPPREALKGEPTAPLTPKAVTNAKDSSRICGHLNSTPMGPSSQSAPDYASFGVLERIVMAELSNKIVAADEAYAKEMYAHLATDKQINAALKKVGYSARKKYRGGLGRWGSLPDRPGKESELYEKFVKITADILEHFGKPNTTATRAPEATSTTHFVHRDNPTHRSRPDISIVATGPSFEATRGVGKACYSNMASFFEVKTQSAKDTDEDLLQQTGVYARQMFMHQPNRKFVRTIVLTEHHVRLINFDRSGTKYSPWINIHQDPHTFVRLILGLASYDEEVLGLDTSIQWTIGKDGKKAKGTVKMVDSNNEELTFELADVHPVFLRAAICGRGTTCWSAWHNQRRGPDGKRLKVLIKDAWRSEGRTPEYTFLEEVKGVNGVTRMLHYEDRRAETKDFRGPHASEDVGFFNRAWLRLVTEQHGQSLRHFKSQKQAIAAIRDAILTHRNMIKFKQILHRDISIQNILLGLVDDDALPGLRGTLIDLDMAIRTGPRSPSDVCSDHRTGTRMYQSCSVLRSYPGQQFAAGSDLPHDYLDDLESFFFVTTHLMFGWDGVGKESSTDFFALWDDENPTVSHNAKTVFVIAEEPNFALISTFWKAPCRELLASFHEFIQDIFLKKQKVRKIADPQARIQKLEKLYESFEGHYQTLKAMFDKALKELDDLEKTQPTQARPAPVVSPTPVPVIISNPFNAPPLTPRPAKRGSGSVEDSGELDTPSKRSRTTAGARSRLAEAMDAQNDTV